MRILLALAIASVAACSFSGPPGGGAGSNGDADASPDAEIDGGTPDSGGSAAPWQEAEHQSRRALTIDNSGGELLAGFPVPVALALGPGAAEDGDGGGLRFVTESGTGLDHEVEVYDGSTGVGVVWVRVDIPADSGHRFWVYYDKEGARAPANRGAQVFAGFEGVYHFADSFNSGDKSDETANGRDLDDINNLDSTDAADSGPASFGDGVDLDATDTEFLATSVAHAEYLVGNEEALTFEAWLAADALDDAIDFTILDTEMGNRGVTLRVGIDSFVEASVMIDQSYELTGMTAVDDGEFHHVALVVDRGGGTAQLFVDGTMEDMAMGLPDENNNGGDGLHIGARTSPGMQDLFTGILDEVRIGPDRSADWIAATALATSLVSVGVEESRP